MFAMGAPAWTDRVVAVKFETQGLIRAGTRLMSAAEAQNEPTMEEILASIRRIIADDDAPAAAAPAPAPAAAEPEDDILDLTDFAEPEPASPPPAAAFDPFDTIAPEPEPAIDDLMIMDRDAPAPAPAPLAETLLAAPAAAAASSAFSRLSSFAAAPMTGGGVGGMTVEDLARELLRPMLKDWLDANLPGIVEAAVEAEVARLAGRR